MKILSVILLILALFIESALTSLPLVLLVLINISAIFKRDFVFVLAFIFGLILDFLTLRTIGASSIFYIVFIYLILLYQSKFEIATNTFILFASVVGSASYLIINHNISSLIIESVVSALIGLAIFIVLKRLLPVHKFNYE